MSSKSPPINRLGMTNRFQQRVASFEDDVLESNKLGVSQTAPGKEKHEKFKKMSGFMSSSNSQQEIDGKSTATFGRIVQSGELSPSR